MTQTPWARMSVSARKGYSVFQGGLLAGAPEEMRRIQWARNFVALAICKLSMDLLRWVCTHHPTPLLDICSSLQTELGAAWLLTYPAKTRWFCAGCWLAATVLYLASQPETPTRLALASPLSLALWEASYAVPILLAVGATLLRERIIRRRRAKS